MACPTAMPTSRMTAPAIAFFMDSKSARASARGRGLEGRAELGRAARDVHARGLERLELLLSRALAARDDRARVSHALARRSRCATDEAHDRLLELALDVISGLFLGR